jgi:8-oxo-dGTP diphosphatase
LEIKLPRDLDAGLPRHEVAIAILYRNGQFLMQLRDNRPDILYPGHWGLFGGHLEPSETRDMAIRRELQEEISYVPAQLEFWENHNTASVIRHVYHARVAVDPTTLILHEGWDMDWLTPAEIAAGQRYSSRAQQLRPLGHPHQRMLLDFIARPDLWDE